MMNTAMDEFVQEAVREAERGRDEGGIPIGAVPVMSGLIPGRGHDRRMRENDPVLHAEIDCLRNAGRIGCFRGCTLYSTLMPCYLCAGAVVAGASQNFGGARDFLESHGAQVIDTELPECREMLAGFIADNPDLRREDLGDL